MFITNLAKSPKIKQELLNAGFTEKQIPSWVGSLNDEPLDDKASVSNVNASKATPKAQQAKNPFTGGKILPIQQANDQSIQSIANTDVEATDQSEVVGQLSVREDDGPKNKPRRFNFLPRLS